MKNILLMGAGKIGEMITEMLAGSGDYHVTVADINEEALKRMPKYKNVKTIILDVRDQAVLDAEMKGKFAVISAAPYQITKFIAQSAVRNDVNYFDLTEDVASTRLVKDLAKKANVALIPQCGLAPGYISIVAYDIAKKFDKLQNVHMRVGALPKFPSNALKYNLTWSTDGLINEYCQPCEAVINGKLTEVPPLEELENFSLDGIDYEAFNTSGGLGTLCETLAGKVQNLNYRTARYPGHRDILKLLLQDLRLNERQDIIKDIFEYALPFTYQDVVLVYVTVTGEIDGRFVQDTYAHKVYNKEIGGKTWSAIQITTSAGICAMVDLLANGKLPAKGFVKQEDVDFTDFITNRFGSYYA
jgi:saccharopine dehydrogenase-like NADP-dependent oxidoreductase